MHTQNQKPLRGHPVVNLDDPFLPKLQSRMHVGAFVFIVSNMGTKVEKKQHQMTAVGTRNFQESLPNFRLVSLRIQVIVLVVAEVFVVQMCALIVQQLQSDFVFVHLRSVGTLDGFYVIAVQHL